MSSLLLSEGQRSWSRDSSTHKVPQETLGQKEDSEKAKKLTVATRIPGAVFWSELR